MDRLDISGYEGIYQLDGDQIKEVEHTLIIPYGNRRAKLVILERYVHTVVNESGQIVYRLWKDHQYEDLSLDQIKQRAVPLKESREDTFRRLTGQAEKQHTDVQSTLITKSRTEPPAKKKPIRLF